jgi:hypothetical protein
MMRALIACAALALTYAQAPALAHDFWANGEPVPAWVKKSCCGPEDVHHLRPDQVHLLADGYHIDGLDVVVPEAKALPSPDGTYWAFWNPLLKPKPLVYCLFVPFRGT